MDVTDHPLIIYLGPILSVLIGTHVKFLVKYVFRLMYPSELSQYPSENRTSHSIRCLTYFAIDFNQYRQVLQHGAETWPEDEESGESEGSLSSNTLDDHCPRTHDVRTPFAILSMFVL